MNAEKIIIPKNKFLSFKSGNQNYIVSTNKISSIVRFSNMTNINNPVESIIGVTVVRGEVYSCLSLTKDSKRLFFLILDIPDINVGIIADKILGFNEKPDSDYEYIDIYQLEKNGFSFSFISPEEYFYFIDGRKASSLVHFLEELKKTGSSVFNYHVNPQKNDFSEWISHIIKDKKLAEEIKKSNSKEEMIELISRAIDK